MLLLQACGNPSDITHTAQLFGDLRYDFDTLDLVAMKSSSAGSPLPAQA